MLKICHDSHLPVYRQPFGAAEAGSNVMLSLSLAGKETVHDVFLRLWGEESGETVVPMFPMGTGSGATYYRAEIKMPEKGNLLWYYFIIDTADGKRIYYGNNSKQRGGVGEIYDHEPPSFQITVYDRGAATPDWFKHGIMYQIFPDRFCREGNQLVEKKGAVFRGSWQDDPCYFRDQETGDVIAYDFFGGNLAGVESKLDYLKELGVSVIYFNPIFESESNHRYDTSDYLTVDNVLGGNAAFDHFMTAAKERNISVILDGVFSHTGMNSRYFNRDGRYTTVGAYQSEKSPYHQWYRFENFAKDRDKYESWWGFKNLPNVDECDRSYQDFIISSEDSVLHHWLKAGVRGWRLDVIDELPPEFSRNFYRELKKTDRDAVLIGEVWEDASNKVSYNRQRAYLSGHELDGVMNYPLRKIILDFLLAQPGNSSADTYSRLMSLLENYPKENLAAMMNLLSGHDVERMVTLLGEAPSAEGMTAAQQKEFRLTDEQRELGMTRSRLAALWQFTFPGVPCIYYGDEIAMEGHKDPVNRRPYQWELTDEKRLAQREWYKGLARLRNENIALQTGWVYPLQSREDGFAFVRYVKNGQDMFGEATEDAVFITAINRSRTKERDFSLQVSAFGANDFEVVFATDEENPLTGKNVTDGATVAMDYGRLNFTLPPLCGAVLKEKKPAKKYPREAGILLHPTSLPGAYPIGDLGAESRAFVDFLAAAGQRVWQILPLTEVDEAFSPYRSPSAFAGNTLLISPAVLVEDGLISREELAEITEEILSRQKPQERVDYGTAAAFKDKLLRTAFGNLRRQGKKYEAHSGEIDADYWLPDYAMYSALKRHFGGGWMSWPEDIRTRQPAAMKKYEALLSDEIEFAKFAQQVFDSQWQRLRDYAGSKGVEILGDLPLFVAPDSADVWAHGEYFDLNEDGTPRTVAGCPPDYFSEDGQLWGNPQYHWERMEADEYLWWVQRLRRLFSLVDRVRIDHFRGLEAFWEIPGEAETAASGKWVKGPGEKLFAAVGRQLGPVEIVAEDLGTLTPEVIALRKKLGLPGMRILQFELGETSQHNAGMKAEENTVVYTGTHDNDTVIGWLNSLRTGEKADLRALSLVLKELGLPPEYAAIDSDRATQAEAAIGYIYGTEARLAVVPMQDILALDTEARMNIPGTPAGNWGWRLKDISQLDERLAQKIKRLAEKSGRKNPR